MTEQSTLSQPMRRILLVAAAILVIILLSLSSCGRDRTAIPTTTPTPDFWEMMEEKYGVEPGGVRAIYYQAPATPFPDMLYWNYSIVSTASPIARPTHDPLYQAGLVNNYPIGWLCMTANLNEVWPSCPAGDCASGINWDDYDECFTLTDDIAITLSSGEVISQPVILDIPPDFLVDSHSNWATPEGYGNGSSSNPYGW